MTDKIVITSIAALIIVFILVKADCFRNETNDYRFRTDYIQGKTGTAYVRGDTDTIKRAARYRHIKKIFDSKPDSSGAFTFTDTLAGKNYGIMYEVKTPYQLDSIEVKFDIQNIELETSRIDTVYISRTDTLKFLQGGENNRFDNFVFGALFIISAGTLIYLLIN